MAEAQKEKSGKASQDEQRVVGHWVWFIFLMKFFADFIEIPGGGRLQEGDISGVRNLRTLLKNLLRLSKHKSQEWEG